MKKYPKVTKEQSIFFDNTSKSLIFEMLIDLMRCQYGDMETDNHFIETLATANEKGSIQTPNPLDIPEAIKKALRMKKSLEKQQL
jgi:hypothetical protein